MTQLLEWLANFFRQFKVLVIVLPWERAARVRLGSRVRVWEPGWHIKLPFIDHVEALNTRLRVTSSGAQTLSSADGHALAIDLLVGFRIDDPLAVLMRNQHPESTCAAIAASAIAGVASCTSRADLTPDLVERSVLAQLREETAYAIDFVRVRSFVFARTYRLLNDNGYSCGMTIADRTL